MKKLIIIGVIALFVAGCGGSSSIDKAINQVEKTLEKVEKNKGKMTEADWQNLEKEIEEPLQVLAKALETNKVGMVQRAKVMTLAAKWTAVVMEAGFIEIEKQTGIDRENWGSELENVSKELEKAVEGIDKDELEKSAKELEKAFEGIDKGELEKAAKELEKALEALGKQ